MMIPRIRETSIDALNRNTELACSVSKLPSKSRLGGAPTISTYTDYFNSQRPSSKVSILDYPTPNFFKKMKQGRIINNPLVQNEESGENPLIDIDYTRKEYYTMLDQKSNVCYPVYEILEKNGQVAISNITGSSSFLDVSQDIDVEKLKSLAITDAWAKINDCDILIGAAIAESGKTIRDLLTLSRKAIKIVRAIKHPRLPKRMNRKDLKKLASESEEIYMQARYNLRPVYYDMMGVMKLTTQKHYSDRYTYRATKSDSNFESDFFTRSISQLPGIQFRIDRESSYTVEARAGVLCNVQDETLWRRIGISMISETAWELTPFSFIADWFANTGQVISSWTPAPGVKILTSWVTVKTELIQNQSVSVHSITDTPEQTPYIGRLYKTETSINGVSGCRTNCVRTTSREPNPSRSILPSIDVNLSIPKILDLAIIGKNLMRSFKS